MHSVTNLDALDALRGADMGDSYCPVLRERRCPDQLDLSRRRAGGRTGDCRFASRRMRQAIKLVGDRADRRAAVRSSR
jgi:hypothetical protein